MNPKMYLPIVCLLFCLIYVLVADAPPLNKTLMLIAAVIFAFLLVMAMRKGKK